MTLLRLRAVTVLAAGSVLIAGCGGSSGTHTSSSPAAVIRGWARALRSGDIAGAARYFALPSVFANSVGSDGQLQAVVIHTEREAQAVNESLSCGAVLTATSQHGRYTLATFRLTSRTGTGAGCGSGTGQSAGTDFLIRGGKIVQWLRAPEVGSGPSTVPSPTQTAPSAPVTV